MKLICSGANWTNNYNACKKCSHGKPHEMTVMCLHTTHCHYNLVVCEYIKPSKIDKEFEDILNMIKDDR